ncbi:MAG: flagellar filament capping protein FliD [Planctomycetota bacterium]|jgi:flagellar capping protein FliD|nr:flagellar filament capping protein FliD [Planctomycetota bacterium]
MAGPAQQITGLASGFDTQSIVKQLMEVEKAGYNKLDVKKQTEQLKLQAYQGVNTFIKKFRDSVSNLAGQKLWNSKSAGSTNEDSLIATANQYAVNGSYSFRVTQTASSAQFSSKGFSSKTDQIGQSNADGTVNKLGVINLNNAGARIDQSARLESFNGGNGVYRGSIRITDARGTSTTVDLSGAETINDIVSAINNASGILAKASIGRDNQGGSFLVIEDQSEGAGKMKIQNVGQGTTATDLGIAGTAENVGGPITGRNLFYLGRETDLGTLNDGLGIEQGRISIDVDDGAGDGVFFQADLSNAKTVGDVLDAMNAAIAKAVVDAGSKGSHLEGLKFQLNEARNGFEFVGAKDGYIYEIGDLSVAGMMTNPETAKQLGLFGSHYIAAGDDSFGGKRVLGDIDSPMLKNINGAFGGGVGSSSGSTPQVPVPLTGSTKLSSLNNGKGLDAGAFSSGLHLVFFEGNGANYFSTGNIVDQARLLRIANDPDSDMDDLLDVLNGGLADYQAANNINGLDDLKFELGGGGIVLTGMSQAHGYAVQNSLFAQELGLVREKMGGVNPYETDLEDLYKAAKVTDGVGVQIVEGQTKLSELLNVDGDPLGADGWAALAAGSFVVTVDGQAFDLTDVLKTLDGNATVESFLGAVNAAMKAEFGGGAPQLLVGIEGMGFQWRNLDLSGDFKAEGGVAGDFGLDKDWTGKSTADFGTVQDSVKKQLNPTVSGYTKPVTVTGQNADRITLGQLYNGRGLAFTGEDADSFKILFLEDTADEYGIEITKSDLMAALGAKAGGGKLSDLSVEDYLDTLNNVIAQKIAADPALAGVEAELGIINGAFGVTRAVGLNDNDLMSFSGELANHAAAGWGFGSSQVASGSGFPPGGKVLGDNLGAIEYHQQAVQGIGSVFVEVGGAEYELSTAGLAGESTLRELIETLNEELQAKTGRTDIAFTMNASGTALALDNNSNQTVKFIDKGDVNTLAADLGFINRETGAAKEVDAYTLSEAKGLAKRYISRAAGLSALGVEPNVLVVTNPRGQTVNIDVSEAKTIGDIVDALNSITNLGIRARVNEAGDGIMVEEYYEPGEEPSPPPDGKIKIADQAGSNTAKQLGLLGEGTDGAGGQRSVINGSMKKTIDVYSNDTLTTLMNRVAQEGYKTAIVNDGSAKPFRLTISSSTTGGASDFIMDSDVDALGLTQKSRGKDAKILYGDPNSGVSPMMLSSATNSNSNAILGLTLDIKSVSDTYTTITVDTDKSKVADEIKAMVGAYNELNDFVSFLDGYDPETNEPGVLFGDTSIRNLMKSIDDMFYMIYNPEGVSYDEITGERKKTWSWMDLGISFAAKESSSGSSSSTWYSSMELDEDLLQEMVSANWDQLYDSLASQRNVSNSGLSKNMAASASFNYQYDRDGNGDIIYPENNWNVNNAINGDYSSALANGVNGFQANKTIEDGENQYTVWLQQASTISRLSIYHAGVVTIDGKSSNGSLRDFKVEYLDANTGKWETLREVEANSGDASHLGLPMPTAVSAIRITATKTNADDGKFRLLDVQAIEDSGLAGRLNHLTTSLGDVTTGFMAERQTDVDEKLKELEDQMARMQEKLDMKEASLWRQFTAMEKALSQLQNQGNQITSMLSSMSAN